MASDVILELKNIKNSCIFFAKFWKEEEETETGRKFWHFKLVEIFVD